MTTVVFSYFHRKDSVVTWKICVYDYHPSDQSNLHGGKIRNKEMFSFIDILFNFVNYEQNSTYELLKKSYDSFSRYHCLNSSTNVLKFGRWFGSKDKHGRIKRL